ncbi:hypothetical protein ACFQQB_11075 [Nonomuraea rubra]
MPAADAATVARRAGAYRMTRPTSAMSARLSIIPSAAAPGSGCAGLMT